MARPKASEGRDTRQGILDAALELFSDNGFHGTGVRDIARAVGIRESAVYHHFPNKEAILDALFAEMKTSLFGPHTASDLPEVPPEQVAPMLERCAVLALEKFGTLRERKRFRILISDGARMAALGRTEIKEHVMAVGGLLTALIKAGIDSGALRKADPELLAMEFIAPLFLWRMLQSLDAQHRFVNDWRKYAKDHVEHFLRAAAAEPVTAPAQNRRSTRTTNPRKA